MMRALELSTQGEVETTVETETAGEAEHKEEDVADVHRFDAGGWYRYDDTVVTETNINSVRSGSNKANGYIFMYIHKSLWDQCYSKYNNNNNNNNQPVICDSSV